MASRTVRLDDDTEEILEQRDRMAEQVQRTPYDIYQELDLGPGGYAVAPSMETRQGVQEALRRKLDAQMLEGRS